MGKLTNPDPHTPLPLCHFSATTHPTLTPFYAETVSVSKNTSAKSLISFLLASNPKLILIFFGWAIAAVFPRLSLPLARFNLDKLDFGQFGFKTPLWKQNRWGLFSRMMSMIVGLHIVTFGQHASQDWPWHMLLPMSDGWGTLTFHIYFPFEEI